MLRKETNYELYSDYILSKEYRKKFPSTRAMHARLTHESFVQKYSLSHGY